MRRTKSQPGATPPRRRWGCFIALFILLLVVGIVLVVLVSVLRPREEIDPTSLISFDTDGLAILNVNRDSPRVDHLLRTLLAPLARDMDSKPDEVYQDVSRLLNLVTFRRAIGVTHYDSRTGTEQWALVVGLKRLGEPVRLLVKRMAERQGRAVTTETREGVVYFWFDDDSGLKFAIHARAFIAASDREWLDTILARVRQPLEPTARATRLYLNLPSGTKHTVLRSAILFTPERWRTWGEIVKRPNLNLEALAQAHAFIDELGIRPPVLQTLAISTTAEPNGKLQLEFAAHCERTTASLEAARKVREQWGALSPLFGGPYLVKTEGPTTDTVILRFGFITPPVEELLGLPAATTATTR